MSTAQQDPPPADWLRVVEADSVLAALRTMVFTIDRSGVIVDARGPIEQHLYLRPDECIGRRALDFAAPEDVPVITAGFGPHPDQTEIRHPLPFRVTLIDRHGGRLVADALVTNALDDPSVQGWVAELVPHHHLTAAAEPLEVLLAGGSTGDMLTAALRALAGPTPPSWPPHNLALCDRLGDVELAEDDDSMADAVITVEGVPPSLAEAIRSCAATEVVPLWRHQAPGTMRDVELDELPLLVAAVARVHGLVAGRMATIEVDGRAEVVLLSLYDARSWARDQGNWRPRWERVVQVLAVALNHRRVQHRLELADTHDGLTGLANRQRFNDVLRAFRGELSVLYVDIDRFRSVNDDHGHFAGDRVLVEVARRLRQACRAGDVVARLGGDEFGIILQGANAQEAVMVGQRIIEAVNEPLPLGVGPLNIAVSVGLARSQLPFGHSPALVDLADRAMYHAKRAGGGRLAVAHPPGSLSTGDDSPMGGLLAIE